MKLSAEHKEQLKKMDVDLLAIGKELLGNCQSEAQRQEIQALIDEISNLRK